MSPPSLVDESNHSGRTVVHRDRHNTVNSTTRGNALRADLQKTERVVWRRIIEVERDPEVLKREVLDIFPGPGHSKHRKALRKTFQMLEEYCGEQMRKNGKMLEICHALLVMRDVALVTDDWLLAIHAGTHDLKENTKNLPRKKDRVTAEMLNKRICRGAGDRLDRLSNMKGKQWEEYKDYSRDSYGSRDVGVILVKLFDHVEKSKELDGIPSLLVKETIGKALGGLRVALKINPDLARTMYEVLKKNAPPQFQMAVDNTYKEKVDQHYLVERGFVFVSSRNAGITTQLLETMPIAGSKIIAISCPVDVTDLNAPSKRDMPIEAIMVPYVSGLQKKEVMELLNKHFEGLGLHFRPRKSHWPRSLQCYHIALASKVLGFDEPENYGEQVARAIKTLPEKIFGKST
jgi:hypothetical protein